MTDHSPGTGSSSDSFTPILRRAREGDEEARSRLFEVLYSELRARAAEQVRRMGFDQEVPATALVHETFLKLVNSERLAFADRAHFLAVASRSMRQVLVDHRRARAREKRGGGVARVPLDDVVASYEERSGDLLDVNAAIEELAEQDETMARAVDLRFFAGLSAADTASILGLPLRTFERRWKVVRAWLASRLRDGHHR